MVGDDVAGGFDEGDVHADFGDAAQCGKGDDAGDLVADRVEDDAGGGWFRGVPPRRGGSRTHASTLYLILG